MFLFSFLECCRCITAFAPFENTMSWGFAPAAPIWIFDVPLTSCESSSWQVTAAVLLDTPGWTILLARRFIPPEFGERHGKYNPSGGKQSLAVLVTVVLARLLIVAVDIVGAVGIVVVQLATELLDIIMELMFSMLLSSLFNTVDVMSLLCSWTPIGCGVIICGVIICGVSIGGVVIRSGEKPLVLREQPVVLTVADCSWHVPVWAAWVSLNNADMLLHILRNLYWRLFSSFSSIGLILEE